MDEKVYWLGFSLFPGVGPKRFERLLTDFGSAKSAWHASRVDLEKSIGKAYAASFDAFRVHTSLEGYTKTLTDKHIQFFTKQESEYPELLRGSKNSPFILYTKGNLDCLNSDKKIAVVGTRKATDYGRLVTEQLATDLAGAGYVIVSGLALGVDSIAHRTALGAGALTIAVLGSGVDTCTPRENLVLYTQILKNQGLIVSEYPPGTEPTKGSFPSRNRIIAGLSLGVLVTEGAEDSGSLITANDAFANNRLVFAVPGPITSHVSKGPIALINKGAKMVTCAGDILGELQGGTNPPLLKLQRAKGDTKEEQKIIDLLIGQNLDFDDLVKQSGLDSSRVGTLLSLMEMKGFIIALPSGGFALA